jgi:hypothetical protein
VCHQPKSQRAKRGRRQGTVTVYNLKEVHTLENLDDDDDDDADIIIAWETSRQDIKISAKESPGCYELKQHKLWFDGGCSNY